MSATGFTEGILLIKCKLLYTIKLRYLVFAVPPSAPPLPAATRSTIGFTEGILLIKCKLLYTIKLRYLVFAVPPSAPPLTAATRSTEGILLIKMQIFP